MGQGSSLGHCALSNKARIACRKGSTPLMRMVRALEPSSFEVGQQNFLRLVLEILPFGLDMDKIGRAHV